jgi:3-hydroxyacyl-CoA dehydrogenase
MTEIKKVAVLGSGVMGSGIAAVMANAGIPVLLLDIVPPLTSPPHAGGKEGGNLPDRNALAEGAIEKQLKGGAPGFSYPKNARLVTPGNFEDDLGKLAECDWIIEVVIEKLEIKQALYQKIEAVRKKGSIVSSNTSTLPLHVLIQGMPEAFQQDFLITHFFNPPRFMKLLEVVKSPAFDAPRFAAFCEFADRALGKEVVPCKDTPGFLANRIGVYWMTVGMLEAIRLGISVEEADLVMGKPLGFPKTGLFGLYDLIGIDLMPLIAKSMLATLPEHDAFRKRYELPELVGKMIAEGYTGRKGKGGFYRMVTDDRGKKKKEVINLNTGEYHAEAKPKLESVDAAKAGLAALFSHPDIGGQYAAAVMLQTLHYAASLIPEISDDLYSVDAAMVAGYNWKYGPFQLIDRLAAGGKTGTDIFADSCEKMGLAVPPVIQAARGKKLYEVVNGNRQQFAMDVPPLTSPPQAGGISKQAQKSSPPPAGGINKEAQKSSPPQAGGKEGGNLNSQGYRPVPIPAGSLLLEDIKLTRKPIKKNASGQFWDLGDGVACLELTSKMNTWDPENLKLVAEAPELVKSGFRALVIGTDAEHFSFGANIGFFMLACNTASWWAISDMIDQGQQGFMGLKYAPFPVVASLSGMALGGGCELLLHADAVVAHMESYPGLVEAGIGVIPGWGGCKEMVMRHLAVASLPPQAGGAGGGNIAAGAGGAVNSVPPLTPPQAGGIRGTLPPQAGGIKEGASPFIPGGSMPAISKAFEYISMAKVAGSAQEAQAMLILNAASRITMNRRRVLAEAKSLALELAKDYQPPTPRSFRLPGASGYLALKMAVDNFRMSGKATVHDEVVSLALARVLTGGDTDAMQEVSEQQLLDLERDQFMELVKTRATQERIAHMLATNKPLRN